MNAIGNNDTPTIMAIALLLSVFALTVNYLLIYSFTGFRRISTVSA
jgi:hypothetical protein